MIAVRQLILNNLLGSSLDANGKNAQGLHHSNFIWLYLLNEESNHASTWQRLRWLTKGMQFDESDEKRSWTQIEEGVVLVHARSSPVHRSRYNGMRATTFALTIDSKTDSLPAANSFYSDLFISISSIDLWSVSWWTFMERVESMLLENYSRWTVWPLI